MIATTHALRAEWTKLRSVRGTPVALLALAGLTIALGAISCATRTPRASAIRAGRTS